MSDVLLICADASPRIGGGHVLRSLAIAEAWLEGDPRRQALLFGAIESPRLIRRAEQSEVLVKAVPASLTVTEELQQIEHWLAELQIRDAPFVVVDGYRFDEGYLREVRERAKALAVVEDYVRLPHYDCDILLNANLYAPELKYSTAPRTKVLLGTEYSLLRTEFRRWKHWPREIPETAHKLLLSCGAADGENLTAVLLKHLEAEPLQASNIRVVLGPENPHVEQIQRLAQDSRHEIEVMVDVEDMALVMTWADIAISAAGSTVWELAFMGVPSILVVAAENQRGIARVMMQRGISLGIATEHYTQLPELCQGLCLSPEKRRLMSEIGRKLIDGDGAKRVVAALEVVGRAV